MNLKVLRIFNPKRIINTNINNFNFSMINIRLQKQFTKIKRKKTINMINCIKF
jgi:hypothetical protein